MGTQKFQLKWNDFETNIREAFKEFKDGHSYFDVTLASDDDYQIQAHKIVLAAGSKFFSEIFKNTPQSNIFIYLKGIFKKDLEHIVNFLYNGQVYVAHDELKTFLDTAKELQIKGLQSASFLVEAQELRREDLVSNMEEVEEHDSTNMAISFQSEPLEIDNLNEKNNESVVEEEKIKNDSIVEQENIINDSIEEKDNSIEEQDDSIEEDKPEISNNIEVVSFVKEDKNAKSENLDLNNQIEEIIEKRGGVWKCRICGKVSKTKNVLIDHAETHIEGSVQSCDLCRKTCRNRPALRSHIRYSHSELSYDCADCQKFGMNKITFKTHNQSKNHKVKRGETILVNFNFE